MTKQKKHIRTSKKGKRFKAGKMTLEQKLEKQLKPMLEKRLNCKVDDIDITELEPKEIVVGQAKYSTFVAEEAGFGDYQEYSIDFNASLDDKNKPFDLEIPEDIPYWGGKINSQIKVGDIFYHSWGYDQTNIDFCKVMRISPTGKSVICRMLVNERVDPSSVVPNPEPYGKEFRLLIRTYDGEEHLVGSYPPRGDEWKIHGSFFKWGGKPMYETPPGFGH